MLAKIMGLLKNHFSEFPGAQGGETSKEEIQLTEKTLETSFSPSYKNFLEKFGGGLVGSYEIFGIKRAEFMGKSLWSVIQNTKFYKDTQKWPGIEDWYVISDDGRGNPIGVDPDGKVWLSDHDAGFEKVKLADSFEEFLHKLLTDTLYDE